MANTELMGTGHWNAYLSLIKFLFGSDIHKISPDDFHVDNNGLVTLRHDTILLFDRGGNGYFDHDSVPNVPRLASRGENYPLTKPKKQDSVIEYTMSPTSRERVGYPTQKPLDVLRQIVGVHSRRGDLVIDPFMGSGSTLIAAKELGREYAGADINPDARQIALERLGQW